MNEKQAAEFLKHMRSLKPNIINLEDAITFAMSCVCEYKGRWFGRISDGTFYLDNKQVRWFPNTTPEQAIHALRDEIGDKLTSRLKYLQDSYASIKA